MACVFVSQLVFGSVLCQVGADVEAFSFPGFRTKVWSVAFSPDGKLLVAGGQAVPQGPGEIWIWEAASHRLIRTLQGHSDEVQAVAVAPGSDRLASASCDGSIGLWDLRTGRDLAALVSPETTGEARSVAFSPDGTLLASTCDDLQDGGQAGVIRIWHLESQQEVTTLPGKVGRIASCVAFSPDGRLLAAGFDDQTLTLWKVDGWKTQAILGDHEGGVWKIAFSPDGTLLACRTLKNSIALWNVAQARKLLVVHDLFSYDVAFSPDGKLLASGIKIWDTDSGKVRFRRDITRTQEVVTSVAFSPDGRQLATGSLKGNIKLWQVADLLGATGKKE